MVRTRIEQTILVCNRIEGTILLRTSTVLAREASWRLTDAHFSEEAPQFGPERPAHIFCKTSCIV